MNQKDKNLLKGVSFLLSLTGLVILGGLRYFSPLSLCGAIFMTYGVLRCVMFLRKVLMKPVDVAELGQWAIVTGCTGGLGTEFATNLASRGMNILLISRNLGKLEKLGEDIKAKYGVEYKALPFDFATSTPEEEVRCC